MCHQINFVLLYEPKILKNMRTSFFITEFSSTLSIKKCIFLLQLASMHAIT
jgi:hypothetical protein